MNVTVNDTIAAGKKWLQARLAKGEKCPLCNQNAKLYKRKINSGMAKALISMHLHTGAFGKSGWVYLPGISHLWQGRDEAGLRYWGLIEESTEPREDGGRAGWWRVTERGRLFVLDGTTVPTYALIYDGKVMGYEGDPVGIRDALGSKFSYAELMEA